MRSPSEGRGGGGGEVRAGAPGSGGGEFWWPVRVYHEDMDDQGVVYHASYLRFMERARTEWLRALGYEQGSSPGLAGLAFVVHRMALEFRSPARYGDCLLVGVRLLRLRRASLVLEQSILPDAVPSPASRGGSVAPSGGAGRESPRPPPRSPAGVPAGAPAGGRERSPRVVLCRAEVGVAVVDARTLRPRGIPPELYSELSRAN